MLKIKSYVRASSLEEAYALNQKKSACILGGMLWLKMGNRNVSTVIDLSGLGLNTIQETEEGFVIGCMTPLRDLEIHPGLDAFTQGAMKESLRHIVGVQFRNCATVGGSLWGRYGFSDVLTMLLGLDTSVELYKGGWLPLEQFASMEKDRDILVRIRIRRDDRKTVYLSQRNTKTDFPVLACCASLCGGISRTVIGARPGRAMVIADEKEILKDFASMDETEKKKAAADFGRFVAEAAPVGGNMRGSREYRRLLAEVLTRRAWEGIGGMKG